MPPEIRILGYALPGGGGGGNLKITTGHWPN